MTRVRGSMDGERARRAIGMLAAKTTHPVRERGDARGLSGPRDDRSQPDEGVRLGLATPVPGPAPPQRHLELQRRLAPIQIRSVEQADLDEAHGGPRIATGQPPASPALPAA